MAIISEMFHSKKGNRIFTFLLIIFLGSCRQSTETEKYQNKRDNVINIHEKVKEIEIEEIPIGRMAALFLTDNYLIVVDVLSLDKLIHIFNKNNFSYVTSIAPRGQGPSEITNIGHIGVNNSNREIYVTDHGKQLIFSYNLDSISNSLYVPKVKVRMNAKQFPAKYQYVNDTLSIGVIIEPVGNSDFEQSMAKWNMDTGDIKQMKYKHPDIKKKRVTFAVSVEDGIYVECYSYYDLMTICDLNGNLKCNIYGHNWDSKISNNIAYYGQVEFCKNRIITLYSGENQFYKGENGNLRVNYPTTFLVFDINGDYIKTLETGYQITGFCYDKENDRIIMDLADETIQFAFLDLNGLID